MPDHPSHDPPHRSLTFEIPSTIKSFNIWAAQCEMLIGSSGVFVFPPFVQSNWLSAHQQSPKGAVGPEGPWPLRKTIDAAPRCDCALIYGQWATVCTSFPQFHRFRFRGFGVCVCVCTPRACASWTYGWFMDPRNRTEVRAWVTIASICCSRTCFLSSALYWLYRRQRITCSDLALFEVEHNTDHRRLEFPSCFPATIAIQTKTYSSITINRYIDEIGFGFFCFKLINRAPSLAKYASSLLPQKYLFKFAT